MKIYPRILLKYIFLNAYAAITNSCEDHGKYFGKFLYETLNMVMVKACVL